MAILNSTFDFHRGYPNGSALAEPFSIKKEAGVAVELSGGTIVTQEPSGTDTVVDKADSPILNGSADPAQMWLVVEGNDDFSGQFTDKCMCVLLGSGVIWSTGKYASGSYTPGTPVSVSGGKLKVKGTNEQIIGYVVYDKTATEGKVYIAS
jgi:hypothetical protein